MAKNQLIATGRVESLCVNGNECLSLDFSFVGPVGDDHSGRTRGLDGHDGAYLKTSGLQRKHEVFNWRSWTGLSLHEIAEVEQALGELSIPYGCLLENMTLSGIPGFSSLAPTTRLVFPQKSDGSQLILAVWEQNGPCSGVGSRLQDLYPSEPNLSTRFIAAAQQKRGVMGFVLSRGFVEVGDTVLVYPPAE